MHTNLYYAGWPKNSIITTSLFLKETLEPTDIIVRLPKLNEID